VERRWLPVPLQVLERGRDDIEVHTATWEGPPVAGPVFVAVHGLGGSHVNWALLAPHLAHHGRVFAPDLAGFGLTIPTGRSATVRDNLDLLAGFIRTVSPDAPVVLLGNSMGGLLSLLLAGTRPRLVDRLVLVAPASPRPLRAPFDSEVVRNFALMAAPGLGERVLAARQRRTTPDEQVRQTMQLCAADPSGLDGGVIEEHVDMARRRREMPHARAAMLQAARSLLLTTGPRARDLWRAVEGVQAPTLLLHGAQDRLVTALGVEAIARRRPDWTHITYDDLGHIPMLEAPSRVADDIETWLDLPRPATRAQR
jgi:pimeloyl-ACP methyl ester carboxylesterase